MTRPRVQAAQLNRVRPSREHSGGSPSGAGAAEEALPTAVPVMDGAPDLLPDADPAGVHAGVEERPVGSEVRSRAVLAPKCVLGAARLRRACSAVVRAPHTLTLLTRASFRRAAAELDQVMATCSVCLMVRRAPVPEAPSAVWDLLPRYSHPPGVKLASTCPSGVYSRRRAEACCSASFSPVLRADCFRTLRQWPPGSFLATHRRIVLACCVHARAPMPAALESDLPWCLPPC